MKAIMVMFDSLNRHLLPPYGCDWTQAPNFQRLAERALMFDRSYVCSMPCMPARREMHTGRPNFLHRSWGPIEPFDDSMPRLLKENGVSTHLISDHYHYWEPGGATYHTQYSTWQFYRGQEGDPWKGQVADPPDVDAFGRNTSLEPWLKQDRVNRLFLEEEEEKPQSRTFAEGLEFIRRNSAEDNWFLQIETFDPHEPFFSHSKYKDRYPEHYEGYRGPLHDWPEYDYVNETPEQVEHMRYEYASLLSMCDAKLGSVLDLMDEKGLWDDTMLILWTDHGFCLGEHGCWAKVWQPFYEEIAHTPFFLWDPRCGKTGERRDALVQPALDIPPTLLEFFGVETPPDMLGQNLQATAESDAPVREAALFGLHGGHVNVTDGRYIYMRAAASEDNAPLFEYTLMPTHMRGLFEVDELRGQIELAPAFSFTKGCHTMKIPARPWFNPNRFGTLLYDLENDPKQEDPVADPALESRMVEHIQRLMKACDAPEEQYQRLGL